MQVTLDGREYSVLPVAAAVPYGEAEDNARHNPWWPGGQSEVATHQAHVVVTALGVAEATEGLSDADAARAVYPGFARVLAALARDDAAIGVYLGDQAIVYEAGPYAEAVAEAAGALPTSVAWFTWAAVQGDGTSCGFTRGLRTFGHCELEVRGSSATPSAVRALLRNVATYVVVNLGALHPGETLGFEAGQHLGITEVDGSFVDGTALRIDLP
jgi:hypothetical protein